MKKSTWLQVVLAAILVILGGAVLLFAETQTMKVKVQKGDTETVEVDVDGAVEVLTIDDLADGEERSFTAGEHTVTVRRDGDELSVTLDGEGLGSLAKAEADDKMIWIDAGGEEHVLDLGDEGALKGHKVMVVKRDDASGAKVIKIRRGEGDEATIDVDKIVAGALDEESLRKALGEDAIVMRVGSGANGDMPLLVTEKCDLDRVRYRCAEDGTEIVIDKDKATQERYLCPVCAREMEKVAPSKLKVMTVVTTHDEQDD